MSMYKKYQYSCNILNDLIYNKSECEIKELNIIGF